MAELASRSTALGKRGRADGRTFVGQCHYGGFWPFADIFGFLFVVGPELPGPWYFLELANILSDQALLVYRPDHYHFLSFRRGFLSPHRRHSQVVNVLFLKLVFFFSPKTGVVSFRILLGDALLELSGLPDEHGLPRYIIPYTVGPSKHNRGLRGMLAKARHAVWAPIENVAGRCR